MPEEWQILNSMLCEAAAAVAGMSSQSVVARFDSIRQKYLTSIAPPDIPTRPAEFRIAEWIFDILAGPQYTADELRGAFDRLEFLGFPDITLRAGATMTLARKYIGEGDRRKASNVLQRLLKDIRRHCARDASFSFDLRSIEMLLERCRSRTDE
jgi:hypothetical protein